MKPFCVVLIILFLLESCHNQDMPTNQKTIFSGACDELDIVYYVKDTFVFKTIDTAAINFYKELITAEDEQLKDTCDPTGLIIFRNKGKGILWVDLTTKTIKDSISCEYVAYKINGKRYRHRLTYRHGMSIDEIYWREVDPKGNPSNDTDTTKFKYEIYKSSQ